MTEFSHTKEYARYIAFRRYCALNGSFDYNTDADAYAALMRGDGARIRALVMYRQNEIGKKGKTRLSKKEIEKAERLLLENSPDKRRGSASPRCAQGAAIR